MERISQPKPKIQRIILPTCQDNQNLIFEQINFRLQRRNAGNQNFHVFLLFHLRIQDKEVPLESQR